MSDFPLYLNTVAGGLDRRDQTIGGFSFVVKIYAVPVNESLLHKGMRTIVQSALRREANEPCHVCWVYQPHRPEKPLPQPQDKK